MAARTAKDSAMRGDSTQSDVAERETVETRSSMIQPNPAYPETGFHAASVQIEIPWSLGFGSIVIKGFAFGGGEEVCVSIHSLASKVAFKIVSSGVKLLFWKIN